jgi:hypothetical protein
MATQLEGNEPARTLWPEEWPRWEAYVARPSLELRLVRCGWCGALMGLQAVPAGGEFAGMESTGCCARCVAAMTEGEA